MRPSHYAAARPILEAAARRAARRYRGRYDDFLAEAHFLYVRAVRAYDGRGPFENMLRVRLRRLADGPRQEARRRVIVEQVDADMERMPAPADRWGDLSEDADAVVRIALTEMRPACRGGRMPAFPLLKVRQKLRNMGWVAGQIADAFTEIREALGG